MGKIKPYKEQDSPKQTAQEPMMATYHQSAIPMDDFINSIPRDALAAAGSKPEFPSFQDSHCWRMLFFSTYHDGTR